MLFIRTALSANKQVEADVSGCSEIKSLRFPDDKRETAWRREVAARKSLPSNLNVEKSNNQPTTFFIHEICCHMDSLFEYVLVFGVTLGYIKIIVDGDERAQSYKTATKRKHQAAMTDCRITSCHKSIIIHIILYYIIIIIICCCLHVDLGRQTIILE